MRSLESPIGTRSLPFLTSFSNVFEYMQVMAGIADVDGRCIFNNRQYLTFTGQLSELGWAALLHPDDRDVRLSTYLTAHEART